MTDNGAGTYWWFSDEFSAHTRYAAGDKITLAKCVVEEDVLLTEDGGALSFILLQIVLALNAPRSFHTYLISAFSIMNAAPKSAKNKFSAQQCHHGGMAPSSPMFTRSIYACNGNGPKRACEVS